jgi:hypothetical protein
MGDIFQKDVKKGAPNFNVERCAKCGEAVFTDKLIVAADGRMDGRTVSRYWSALTQYKLLLVIRNNFDSPYLRT